MRVHAHQGDTLDALLWRHTGRTVALVEATLAANPGLADLGVVLPHGTAVDIPESALRAPPLADQPLIKLWD
ncbi:MAG: tail protein X [Xanthomonadales bacterium]|nr:tail protein X [Xanthomonadales bacterium]